MPWTEAPGAGFTTGMPWLRLGPDTATRNVRAQQADPGSVLSCYRRLLRVRRSLPSLQEGRLTLVRTAVRDVLAYRRHGAGQEVLVAIAFGAEPVALTLPRPQDGGVWATVVGTHPDPAAVKAGQPLHLRPREGVILVSTSR